MELMPSERNMTSLTRIKTIYLSHKKIMDILEEGNKGDERYTMLLQALTVGDLEQMVEFIKYCEDIGIPKTIKKEIN